MGGSDDGSDIYLSLPEGDSAISMVRSVARQHSRAHEACLVALTEIRRDADLHCKELKKVLRLQGHEIEALRQRRSSTKCATIFFAAFGLGLGLAQGLQVGLHPTPQGNISRRPALGMWR